MTRILLVEDDLSLGQTLSERLSLEGYRVSWQKSAQGALREFHLETPTLVVLDVGLPDGSGFEVASKIREESAVPFLFLTARSQAEDRLKGFELGAEEYIPKPFHLKELFLRIRHVLDNHSVRRPLKVRDVEIDFERHRITKLTGESVQIPPRDFQVLKLLIDASPRVLSRDEILDRLWGEDKFPSNRGIDNAVLRLRQNLGAEASQCIHSVRGVGYRWDVEGSNE